MYGLSEEIIETLKIIEKNNNVKIYIFGSRARGDYKEYSDIDICITEEVDQKRRYKIMDDVDKIMTHHKIDLIFIQDVKNEEFIKNIDRDKKEI
jgi:predicted nucleotidyltransferase